LVLKRWSDRLPIIRAWQPDDKFRAARARNLAISKVECDYTIFIDGDCLLPPRFIESHCRLSASKKLIAGGRFLMNQRDTERLLNRKESALNQVDFHEFKFKRIPLGPLRELKPNSWEIVRSCNMSLHTSDVLEVSGFDEQYVGWGREDSDFVIRLLNSSVTIKSGRFQACVKHLYHPEADRNQLAVNDDLLRNVLAVKNRQRVYKSILDKL